MTSNYLLCLCLIIGTLTACHKTDLEQEQNPQILQATVPADPTTTVDINHATGIITVYPSPPKSNWIRSNQLTVNFQTTSNTVLVPVNPSDTQPLNKQVSLAVMGYDNSKPVRMIVRDQNPSRSVYKEYQLQFKAAGPVHFESMPALKDTVVISLKYYQTYSVNLPISNLYDGQPHDYRVYATLAGSTSPIELAIGYDDRSQDYVQFYFDRQTAKPGVYTIELNKADGQRAVSPTRIVVDNSREY